MIRQKISQQIWDLKYRDSDETEQHFYERIATGLFGNTSQEDKNKYLRILGYENGESLQEICASGLQSHLYSLAGRGMYAVGTDRTMQTFSNCFVLPFKKDSLSAIMDTAKESAMTMKAGGGVGYSLSILRPEAALISTSKTTSSGAVSFLKILDSTCSVIKAGNSRRGAQMGAMGIWHPDIKKFITAKRNGDLKNFNLSVFVSDAFMEAKNNDKDWNLVFPDINFEKYNEEWDGNIKGWEAKGYPVRIYETVKATELWDLIMKSNYNFAEPGILFEDSINEKNTLWYSEYIQTTNPCITGDSIVKTDKGNISIKELIQSGIEKYKVLSYNTINEKFEYKEITFGAKTRDDAELIELTFDDGSSLRLTPDHKVYTSNRGYVEASKLNELDILVTYNNCKYLRTTKFKNEDVYDISVKDNHNFFANNILVHNCGEQPLYWYGSCNLGPINLSNHVKNIFTGEAEIDWKQLEKSIIMLTIMLDKLLDISYYPIEKQAIEVQEKRLIGLGFTGLGDMFSKLCIPYGSQKSIEVAEQVTKFISEVSYLTSSKLAKEFGKFPAYDERILESYNVSQLSPEIKEHIEKHGLRNSRLTSVAPVGTISLLLNNCSSGIEPNFALEYTRKIIGADGVEFFETVETDAWNLYKNSELYNGNIPDFFVTAQDLKPIDHINVQAAVQKWICTAVSKTTNCPKEISFDDFKEIYDLAYEKGLKGCTTYRPNDVLGSILEVKKEFDPKTTKEEQDEFFEAWKTQSTNEVRIDDVSLPSEYPMKGYKITSEGKKWYVHVAFKDKKLKKPFAIFATTNNKERNIETYDTLEKLTSLAEKSGIRKELIEQNEQKSSAQTNVNKMCRILGMLLRHNVPIVEIVKTLDNVEVPVSSFIFRIKKFLLSFIDEIETTGEKCPECGSPVKFESGCKSCTDCFWSKCS